MKTKIVPVILTFLFLSVIVIFKASAHDIVVNDGANAGLQTQGNATSTAAKATLHVSATGTTARNEHATTTNATSTNANNKGQFTAEAHRSTVAFFVESLLAVADREGGIGAEVREVAKAQNDSATTTANAMAKVEERGSVRTFFLGGDYKNLGVIRSELAKTNNNIARLKSLLDKTTNDADHAELDVQIEALEAEQAKVTDYVEAHENVFSLFGWFARLFVK